MWLIRVWSTFWSCCVRCKLAYLWPLSLASLVAGELPRFLHGGKNWWLRSWIRKNKEKVMKLMSWIDFSYRWEWGLEDRMMGGFDWVLEVEGREIWGQICDEWIDWWTSREYLNYASVDRELWFVYPLPKAQSKMRLSPLICRTARQRCN